MSALTVVTYHFVRDPKSSRFPELKALPVPAFENQLEYLGRHYRFVSMDDCFSAVRLGKPLPETAVLLTFDDAYADHYETVFPLLRRRGIPGCFFPPAKAVERREVMDINRIHFLLASVGDPQSLVDELFSILDRHRADWSLESNEAYWRRLAVPFRWDGKEVIFIKRLLQRELPEPLRRRITRELFARYVAEDETAFSRDLYMSESQLAEMVRAGMYVGSHGYDHHWLDRLEPEAQLQEIDRALELLSRIGSPTGRWAIAYPFGSYNASLLEIARKRGAVLGFTSASGVASLNEGLLELPRLDTNELPR